MDKIFSLQSFDVGTSGLGEKVVNNIYFKITFC